MKTSRTPLVILFLIAVAVSVFYPMTKSDNTNDLAIKQEAQANMDSLLSLDSVKYIPGAPLSFTICDFSSPSFRALIESPSFLSVKNLTRDSKVLEEILNTFIPSNAKPETKNLIKKLKALLNSLQSSALTDISNLRHYVNFQSIHPDNTALKATAGHFAVSFLPIKLDGIVATLKDLSLPVEEIKHKDFIIYKLSLSDLIQNFSANPAGSGIPDHITSQLDTENQILYFGSTGSRIGITHSKYLLISFLNKLPESSVSDIFQSPGFNKAMVELPYEPEQHYCYNYSDIDRQMTQSVKTSEKLLKKTGEQASSPNQKQLPKEISGIVDKFKSFSESQPFNFSVSRAGYKDNKSIYQISTALNQKGSLFDSGELLEALQSAEASKAGKALAASPLLAFTLNMKTLRSLLNVLENLSKDFAFIKIPAEIMDFIENLQEVGLAINIQRNENSPDIQPQIQLAFRTDNKAHSTAFIKSKINQFRKTAAPNIRWQNNEINQVPVKILPLPIPGISIVMATTSTGADDYILITSSIKAMSQSLLLLEDLGENLADSLPTSFSPSFFQFFINFSSIPEAIDILTPVIASKSGKSIIIPESLKQIMKLVGQSAYSFYSEDDYIHLDIEHKPGGLKTSRDSSASSDNSFH